MAIDQNGVSGHDTPAEGSSTEESSIKRDDTPESTEVIATLLSTI
jgi:hypothetical protein